MAANFRTAYLDAYKQLITFIPFLSTFFRTTPRDIRNAESVKIDIKRGEKRIAPVISDITQRGGKIIKKQYTGKEFKPPIVALGSDFTASDVINKIFGISEYDSEAVEYVTQMQMEIMDIMEEIEARINRSIEFQASQIFQTGELTLYDENGIPTYYIDFFPKITHFPTVSVDWSDEGSDPDSDLENIIDVITEDGQTAIRNIIFGKNAYTNYIRNTKIQDKFDLRRVISGDLDPREQNPDVTFLGEILIGAGRYMCWRYEGTFIHPETDTLTSFLHPDNVLLLPDAGGMNVDFRKVYCRVFTITGVNPRFAELIPTGQVNLDNRSYTIRVWADEGADTLNVELKTRPLCLPVSIDSFGCLTTENGA